MLACKLLKKRTKFVENQNGQHVVIARDKLWFLNYGESPRCLAAAGISLSVHTLIAQKLPDSPLLEMPRERLIITNDCFAASFDKKPNRDGRKLSVENNKTDTGRLVREFPTTSAESTA